MTPAEHLAEAEWLLTDAGNQVIAGFPDRGQALTMESIAHALIAAAAELGVPHADTTAGGASATPQQQAG